MVHGLHDAGINANGKRRYAWSLRVVFGSGELESGNSVEWKVLQLVASGYM